MLEYTVRVCDNGGTHWYLKGLRHREDGPAIEWPNGRKEWYLNGLRHREDGPAIEWASGYKAWYLNGLLHREDGPARECPDGHKEWWLHGDRVTEEEHKLRTAPIIEMTVEEISKALGKKVKVIA